MLNFKNKSITKTLEVCEAVAEGNFEKRILNINEKGEMGQLMHTINDMVDRFDAYLRETQACLEYVCRNQHFRLIAEKGLSGSFVNAAITINTATHKIKERNDDFAEIADKYQGEMKDIVTSVSSAVEQLNKVSADVKKSSVESLEQSSTVSVGAEQASQNMQGVASATEQLTAAIGEINSNVCKSTEITSDAVEKSIQMSAEIEGLADASTEISNVMKLISEIAEQTNLLALNATIEAARAGEAGKGFAVVAQEVKALASQTAKATEDTEEQIENIQKATTRAVDASKDISATITQVREISTIIAAAIEEQSAATQEIARNVNEAATGTSNVSDSIVKIREVTESTQEAANNIVDTSADISEQEVALKQLQVGMTEFLEEVRKTG